ncbi:MAG: hypothetical protein RSD23_00075 [Ruthenibacterium sp.]
MNKLVFLTGAAFFAFGLFAFLCAIFGAPSRKKAKYLREIIKSKPTEKQKSFDSLMTRVAIIVSKMFPFSKRQLEKTQSTLYAADISESPQLYLSRCITKALLLFAVALAASAFFKPMLLVAVCVPMLVYASEAKKAGALTIKRKEAIERDLPQFVATLAAELPASRDVVRIVKHYSETCGAQMQAELRITVADMESGSYETALNRMEARCNSVLVSDVLRGLIGTVRGNDETAYFRMLNYDMKQWEQTNLKKLAQKCVPKLSVASMIMMISVIALLVGVLLIDVMRSAQAFF